jgi:TonB family protein
MNKAIALLAIPLALQGCSYSYPIWATIVGNRLAFESGDRAYDCFTNIRVSAVGPLAPDPKIEAIEDLLERGKAEARRHTVWETDAVQTYECRGHFPVVYGAPMPDITIVEPKPLRIGVPYEVSTYGPKGAGGNGCFRINPDRRPENLPDQDCFYMPPPPPPGPPPAPGAILTPAKPRRDLASSITAADYPVSARARKEEGTVAFALDVNKEGRVEGCAITRSSGSAALDSATCRIMRSRARFTPAIDDTGNAAASSIEQEINWSLSGPASSPSSPKPQVSRVPGIPGGIATNSVSAPAAIVTASPIRPTPINAMPPADKTGPSQMYALTPYRGIERRLRSYPSLAACERARSKLPKAKADRRLCGLGGRGRLF